MKINKHKLLQDLIRDKDSAEIIKKEWDTKRDSYINETYGKPYGNEVDGKSKIVSKDIKRQIEWLMPSATDPFLSSANVVKCNPVTWEDAKSARQNELLLNTQFCRKFPRYNFINKAVRVLATEGTVVVQTGWDYEEEEVTEVRDTVVTDELGRQHIVELEQTVTKIVKNQPTAVVCRNEDIYLDPTCMDDMDKCQFIIYRYETDISTLKSDGRYKNLDRVMSMDTRADTTFIPEDHTRFNFSDEARKKKVVYEYWGNYDINEDGVAEPIVCAWIGNTIIRLEDNPYPDKKPPFIIVPFNAIPFQMYGEALAENIGDNQKVKTAITRGIIDNMARSNNGQVGVRRGSLDMNNRKKFLQGKNFEFNGTPADFWQGGYNQIPGSVFDMLSLMNNEIESQTGVKSFSGGITGSSLGSTATAARGAMDATAMMRMHLVRNIAENMMKPLLRKWMSYNSEFLEEEEIVRVTNEEYVPIKRDDLDGRVDIDISIATQEDNSAKSQELSFLLQTVGPNEDPAIRRELMAQIMELMRMPDQAKKLREYQPQPDPVQQQIQQMELQKIALENQKLQAEIQDLMARAGENQIDGEVKRAKMQVELAKARKLSSEADKSDLDFIRADEQTDIMAQHEMKQMDRDAKMGEISAKLKTQLLAKQMDNEFKAGEKERDRQHQAAIMAFQAQHRDKNIGTGR